MRCKNCWREVNNEFKFCPYCAANLHEEPDQIPLSKTQRDEPNEPKVRPERFSAREERPEIFKPEPFAPPKQPADTTPRGDGKVHFETQHFQEGDLFFEDLPDEAFRPKKREQVDKKSGSRGGYQIFRPEMPSPWQPGHLNNQPPELRKMDSPAPVSQEPDEQQETYDLPDLPEDYDLSDLPEDYVLPDPPEDFDLPDEEPSSHFVANLPQELEEEPPAPRHIPDEPTPYAGSPRAKGRVPQNERDKEQQNDEWAEQAPYVTLQPEHLQPEQAANVLPVQQKKAAKPRSSNSVLFRVLLVVFLVAIGGLLSFVAYRFFSAVNSPQGFSFSSLFASVIPALRSPFF